MRNKHPSDRTRRNAHLAGKKHPKTDIPFDADGYPDFSQVSKKDVEIEFSSPRNRDKDRRAANKAAGFDKTPAGHEWHHHQDGKTMQLIPKSFHRKTGHGGGFSAGR